MTGPMDFLEACRGRPVKRTPVWIMRQAGRYLPQYREIRSRNSFLELCKNSELAATVTLQPVDILGVDAAILFSDILIPALGMGVALDFNPGPVLDKAVTTKADIEALRVPCIEEEVPFVFDTIRLLRRELAGRVPLIGFCGGPFTLACYLVEGQGSKDFLAVKRMMFSTPELFTLLMNKVTETNRRYLNAQIDAGVQAVQIFDTWGGILCPADYETYILPFTRKLIAGLNRQDIPVILFVRGSGTMLDLVHKAGADVIGLDWHIPLGRAREILGTEVAVQGNLDPSVLFAPTPLIEKALRRILDDNNGRRGHIFNLGHGILPGTPVEHVQFLVDRVHQLTSV